MTKKDYSILRSIDNFSFNIVVPLFFLILYFLMYQLFPCTGNYDYKNKRKNYNILYTGLQISSIGESNQKRQTRADGFDDLGRSLVAFRAQHADIRQIAVVVCIVKAVADDKFIRNREAAEIGFQTLAVAVLLVEERDRSNAGRIPRGEELAQILHR